jgi:uncharacterized protein (DUF1330 family)
MSGEIRMALHVRYIRQPDNICAGGRFRCSQTLSRPAIPRASAAGVLSWALSVAVAWRFATNCAALEATASAEGHMPTYIVGDIHITDAAAYQAHVPRALATIARFGGRVVAGGSSRVDLLEGDPLPEWIFIIEFPTADAARRWYQSDDYHEALKARLSASHGRVFLIEGSEVSRATPVARLDGGAGR